MEQMNLYQKLSCIQNEMKVPKNLFNKFGNYYYRNAETILETAKPICQKYKCTLIVKDVIENVEGRFYVKAIVCLYDWESDKFIEGVAYAREDENKKGMDGSQITGSTSSYARKYALNGLFNLDDVKDADTDEYKEQQNKKKESQKDNDREELLKQYARGYKALSSKGFDLHNEQFISQCKAETKLSTLDIQKLTNTQLKTLVDYFAHIYIESDKFIKKEMRKNYAEE